MNTVSLLGGAFVAVAASVASGQVAVDRTVLPVHEPAVTPITELDARKAKAPERFEVKAPAARPTC